MIPRPEAVKLTGTGVLMENSGDRMIFADYFELVVQRPELAQSACRRVAGALVGKGLPVQVEGFLKVAATGSDIGNRVMVMVGDPKATAEIMDQVVSGFEAYSRSDAGAFYAIEGCPYKEEPFHLIPPKLRQDFPEFPGLAKIKADLCSDCDKRFEGMRIEEVPVSRYPSEGQFSTGNSCISAFEYRGEGGPGAEQLTLEMVKANRGLLVGSGLFEIGAPKQLLYPFLTITERSVKVPRYPVSSLDIVIAATATPEQYTNFSGLATQEALHDRVVSVWV